VSRAVLSIGSNLGDRLGALRSVVAGLRPSVVAVSSVYETKPWGLANQPDFLNAVVIAVDPSARPFDWLTRAHAFEAAADRVREVRWGPRTLDVDVIDVDGIASDDRVLTLPHPRAGERAFVLVPWAEIDDDPQLARLVDALPELERASIRRRAELSLQ
jgi:2-amino-4-hydroxy-6-hydroxymethyldihydropteridine diphosphokinase